MKQETLFYIEIKHALQDLFGVDNFHYQRIESPETAQGIPDINICVDGYELWLECKVNNFKFSALQIAWIKRRNICGGKAFGIVKQSNCFSVFSFSPLEFTVVYPTIHMALKAILTQAFDYKWSD